MRKKRVLSSLVIYVFIMNWVMVGVVHGEEPIVTSVETGFKLGAETFSEASWWAVEELREAETAGYSVDNLQYQEKMTRLDFCGYVVDTVHLIVDYSDEALEEMYAQYETPFIDVNDKKVTLAFYYGIVEGVGDDLFDPESYVTRQEVVVMLMRMIDYLDETFDYQFGVNTQNIEPMDLFEDHELIADWAIDSVYRGRELKVLDGVGNNRMDPLGEATNEQGILFNIRVYNVYREPEVFELIKNPGIIVLNELEEVTIMASDFVNSEQLDQVFFAEDIQNFELGVIEPIYKDEATEPVITGFLIDAKGVREDESQMMTLPISSGEKQLDLTVIFRLEDVTNHTPMPMETLEFTIYDDEILTLTASDLALDPDGDSIVIESYQRVGMVIGTGVLENQMNLSRFIYTPKTIEDSEYSLSYELVLSDQREEISVVITIKVQVKP